MDTKTEPVTRFKYVRTLEEDPLAKRVVLLGSIDDEQAILTLEKTGFTQTVEPERLLRQVRTIASNDVYWWGTTLAEQDVEKDPTCKYSLVYPATETHVRKYESARLHMIRETPEAYQTVVKPYIETMKGDRLQWVTNILHHGAEAERVLFRNDDYVVLPDMKWDGQNLDTLYCCCIVYDDSISSVRDLTVGHLGYLERIRTSILEELPRIYQAQGLQRDNLRLYVHYQPSYYHFHIHVVNANFLGLANSMLAGKAILLEDVIDNLFQMASASASASDRSLGYASKTINYQLKETHKLWDLGLRDYAQ